MKTRSNANANNDTSSQPKNGGIKRKSKKSVDIIIENQPLKFRQTNNNNEQQSQVQSDDENVWENGSIPSSSTHNHAYPVNNCHFTDSANQISAVTVEFDALPESSSKKKRVRRATAYDKEVAELVHKVHLLCLLARGRVVDAACDDPFIQATLLSLLPSHLLKISEATKLTVNVLTPLVSWFHRTFHVRSPSSSEKPFHSALACAVETLGGSPEEVAALSVALFRALNLTTRFVSILDVASLKADTDADEPLHLDRSQVKKDIFSSSTLMVCKMSQEGTSAKSSVSDICETSDNQSADETHAVSEKGNHPRRKGDLEFEMQLQMAMAATAMETPERKSIESTSGSLSPSLKLSSPFKKMKRIAKESPSSPHVISTAIGSKKVGAPLHWAEVYCCGENMTGKWVHIDAVNAIIDGELKVEASAAACKRSLRYVLAFAGQGAKDVTRRYCAKWYKISPERINSGWWDAVLYPYKKLEARATSGMVALDTCGISKGVAEGEDNNIIQAHDSKKSIFSERLRANVSKNHETSTSSSSIYSRSTIEDMELATRALTEPLPTNQQAYRNHPLYAIEKWLTKYQCLHPKGPILGFCSGHAVYPRTCVQNLHTKERWLREGLQVRVDELPSKVVKSSKNRKQVTEVDNSAEGGPDAEVALFGKWQTETLYLPPAVDGIVPKNERGQVDVWSEKCLPPGTVHLRLPRLVPVAKKLGIDFAPAMIGFEFRNGRSYPVYEGIVVCKEFRETILEAYAEEEKRREEEEKKRDERQAIARWYQLLSSMVTRQRLNDAYMNNMESESFAEDEKLVDSSLNAETADVKERASSSVPENTHSHATKIHETERTETQNHDHVFVTDDESFDEDSMTRTKRCRCGLFIQVEEL